MLDDWKRLLFQGLSPQDSDRGRRRIASMKQMCGNLFTGELEMPNCTSTSEHHSGRSYEDVTYCSRQYDLYIPTAACENIHYRDKNILPLVFAVHCYGCQANTMSYLIDYAEFYNYVLVIPHGIDNSFNAEQCCGTALTRNVDDIGFFEYLIQDLSLRWRGNLVSSDLVYGFGWSNGGYMVVNAAHLFRAIAPVSGYQVFDEQGLSNMVEQIAHRPIGLFLHHSQDDTNVAITGCCTDTTMPECCCGLSDFAEQCQAAPDFVTSFAKTVNHCEGEPTVSLEQVYTGERADVTCYQAGSNCWANTTYCIHNHRGHFNHPSFERAFPMMDEISEFFVRDACEVVGKGSWSTENATCDCVNGNEGFAYCLNNDWAESYQEPDWASMSVSPGESMSNISAIGLAAIILMAFIAMFLLAREERKYHQFKAVNTFEMTDWSVDPKLDEDDEMNEVNFRPRPIFARANLSKHI